MIEDNIQANKCLFNNGKSCLECDFSEETIFKNLTSEQRHELQSNVTQVEFKRKQNIFLQNTPPSWVYFVHKGLVKITIFSPDGKEQIVRLAKQGDVIGYRAVLQRENLSSNAVALNDVKLCGISRSFFRKIAESNLDVSKDLLQVISRDLGIADKRLMSLSYKNVRQKISESILIFAQSCGFVEGTTTIREPIYRKDIADYAGITIETTIRSLAEMQKSGIIETNNKFLTIKNLPALQEIAAIY